MPQQGSSLMFLSSQGSGVNYLMCSSPDLTHSRTRQYNQGLIESPSFANKNANKKNTKIKGPLTQTNPARIQITTCTHAHLSKLQTKEMNETPLEK